MFEIKNKKKYTMIRVHKKFKDKVKTEATSQGLSIRQYLEFLIEKYGKNQRNN